MFSLDREKDTICAQATASGVGALAMVRISGADSRRVLNQIAPTYDAPQSHKAELVVLRDPSSNEMIDECVVTYFQTGRSFTGEESVEISCHGSPAVVQEILRKLVESGARIAEPGEFTYRAFINGRIDLIQAESILQLIESRSQQAARASLRQLRGDL
jgi:tRNA modification GTPase